MNLQGRPKNAVEEFLDHRLLQPCAISSDHSNLPGPLNWQLYKDNSASWQTTLCTRLAMRHYNNENPAHKARKGAPKDSHMFILKIGDQYNYWHLYFRATVAGRKTPFFAELRGRHEPDEVTMCRPVDKYNGSLDVCTHCWGGIRHPKDGGFVGYLGLAEADH